VAAVFLALARTASSEEAERLLRREMGVELVTSLRNFESRRWDVMCWHRSLLAMVLVLVLGCDRSKQSAAGAPKPATSAAARDARKTVRLSEKVIADARIKTTLVAMEVLVGTLDLTGEVTSDPDRTARVASPVAGLVEQVSFKEGTPVKKGDVLAIVRVPELGKIRSAYASTQVKAKAARSNADRLSELRTRGLSSEQESLNAGAEAQSLEAETRALGEQIAAMGMAAGGVGALLTLRAPLAGVAVTRDAVAGQPISADQSIGTIADLSDLWFLARVYERDLDQVQVGAKATVKLDALPSDAFEGTVGYVGKQVDPKTRTLMARIQITNREGRLRLGLYGTAHVHAADETKKPASIVVPRTAVLDMGGKSVTFVKKPDGSFEVHEVVVGDTSLDKVEIKSGLDAGQEVVVEGGFTVKSALLKSTFAEEE
jgi:cobalt-zinc-cadmium efflux system membrane fusion protein